MAAYFVFDIHTIHSQDANRAYKDKVMELVSKFGGSYILIGGGAAKEGKDPQVSPVMIEFPSMEKAEEWYISGEYNAMKISSEAVFFEGCTQE